MAKDKSKGKKSTASSGGFAKPSEAPAGESWSITDGDKPKSGNNDGELFIITPLREDETDTKDYGRKKMIVADVVHVNEKKPEKSEEHKDVWIFGGWLMGAIRSSIQTGEKVLCRLVKTPDKSAGKGYVWKFEDGDADDVEKATEYLDSLKPFGNAEPKKKAKKSEPEPEPKKKAKKSKAEPEPEPKKGKGKKGKK